MVIIKSIGFGILSLIVGNFIGFVLWIIAGLVVEPIVAKFVSELSLKKFRHIGSYGWIGLTVGLINSMLVYYYQMNGWILLLVFIAYLVFFMGSRNSFYVLESLCAGDEKKYKKLSKTTETITFIGYMIGLYGLWTILTN